MARKAKRDYCKGVYRMLYMYSDLSKFDLVFTTSLDGRVDGRGLNCDLELAKGIVWNDLKNEIKKNKITRAIWYGDGDYNYVMPKDVLSGRHAGVIVFNNSLW